MIVSVSDLNRELKNLQEQQIKTYGFGHSNLPKYLKNNIIKGSFILYKLEEGLVLLQVVFLPNTDEPVVSATIKPKGVDVSKLVQDLARQRGIKKTAIYEPNDDGFTVRIEEID